VRRFLSIATIALMNIRPAVGQAEQAAPTGSRIRAAVPMKACAFDMTDVRLLDGPFKHAMEVDGQYLLRLEADRLLSGGGPECEPTLHQPGLVNSRRNP